MKIIYIAIYVIGNNLHKNRWKNPIPAFKECEYEINQLFNLTFAKNAQFLDWLIGGLDTIFWVVPLVKKLEIFGFSAPELVIKMETEYLDQTKISMLAGKTIEKMFNEIGERNLQEISNIALFCTHYPLFKKEISKQLQEKFGKKFHLLSQGEILSDKILDEAEKILNCEQQNSIQENKTQNDLENIDSSSLQPNPKKSEIKISSSFTDIKSQKILEHNIKLFYQENCAVVNFLWKKRWSVFTKNKNSKNPKSHRGYGDSLAVKRFNFFLNLQSKFN